MKIGIVNDVPMALEALRRVVLSVPDNQVAWMARDGAEAIAMVRKDVPDVVLMDLIMPVLDGVEATRRIMAEHPCAILVVTATVTGRMSKVYEAMGYGALDAVDTPVLSPSGQVTGGAALLEKIATVGKLLGKASSIILPTPNPPEALAPTRALGDLVVLGASTGGPKALAEVIETLPKNWSASVVIVQHVDAAFAPDLARWLAKHTGQPVELVKPGEGPTPGKILLASTNDHLLMTPERTFVYSAEPSRITYRPSVDVFFASVAKHWTDPGVGVIMTGMGRDGAMGLLRLRQSGWFTIAQDQATSVIWGMPKAAFELGAASRVLPLGRIGEAIAKQLLIKASASGGTAAG
jgi:two-component system response regulator WspF